MSRFDFEFNDDSDFDFDFPSSGSGAREIIIRRPPSPGIAAVLSVFLPGLGHVYSGRLCAAALWFLATAFAYWAIILPGFLLHGLCIWSAWRGCPEGAVDSGSPGFPRGDWRAGE